jgi:hypothetical protein
MKYIMCNIRDIQENSTSSTFLFNYDGPGQDDGMKVSRESEAVRELLRRTTRVL